MKKVSIIGTGNVATHLAKALKNSGVTISQIYGRNEHTTKSLALKVGATAVFDILEMETENIEAILISVNDDAIQQVANALPNSNAIVMHTSGTVGIEALEKHTNNGVFYPLQTFSKNKKMDLSTVPFCIEGNNRNTKISLLNLANLLTNDVRFIDSKTRKSIHIAAVFASNFSNHMLAISDKLLNESGQDLSILFPLVNETISKAFSSNPIESQTGPAERNDIQVMKNHLAQLENEPLLQNIYKNISASINNFKNE